MGDVSLLGSVCASLPDGDFISPVGGVDKRNARTVEESCEKRFEIRTGQITFDQFDIWQRSQFLGYQAFIGSHLCANMPADSTGNSDEGCALPSGRVDGCDYSLVLE